MKCWICGGNADTGEHRAKRSDLAAVFRSVSQQRPLYTKSIPSGQEKIKKVGSLNSNELKWNSKICNQCNSSRTQPADLAWEKLSAYLQNNTNGLKHRGRIKLQAVFPGSVEKSMLDVHLYFVKMFGCIIEEHQVPIPINGFADSIMKNQPHPEVYMGFGFRNKIDKKNKILLTQIESITEQNSGTVHFATWQYWIRNVFVDVIYSIDPKYMAIIREFWHPDKTQKYMKLSELKNNQRALEQAWRQ